MRASRVSLVAIALAVWAAPLHSQVSCANLDSRTALGCEFRAVDLDKIEPQCSGPGDCGSQTCNLDAGVCEPNAAGGPFSIVVTNPQLAMATLTIVNMSTETSSETDVSAETSKLIDLERLDVSGNGITRNVYRVESTLPVFVLKLSLSRQSIRRPRH